MSRNRAEATFEYEDPTTGDSTEIKLPAHWEVCPRCQGEGTHTNPNIDGNGITADEWNGPDWDEESREMYLSGGYDVECEECHGQRLVPVVDLDTLDPEVRKQYEAHLEAVAQCDADEASERRYFAAFER